MARKKTAQATPSSGPQAQQVPPAALSETPPAALSETPPAALSETPPAALSETPPAALSETPPAALSETPPAALSETPPLGTLDAEGGAIETAAIAPAPAETSAPRSPATDLDPLERVKALVLHDSIYGKCGEVREFAAEHVPALKVAGYIDPHPKAVESAGG